MTALAGLLLAFANGANDTFKGVATLYGTRTLSYRGALLLATLSTLLGSLCAMGFASTLVARFSGRGLVPESVATDPAFQLSVGMGSAATVLLATALGLPISTTHALTGALIGGGVVLVGPDAVAYARLTSSFVAPLMLSPLLACLVAAALYLALRRVKTALGLTEQTCVCVGGAAPVGYAPGAASVPLAGGVALVIDRKDNCERRYVGAVFGVDAQTALDKMHVLSAAAVGFARGLNDTPKIAALLIASGAFGQPGGAMLVAVAMAAGGVLGARRVAETMSFRITALSQGQGFSANLVTSALVILASPLGLPVSTTHVSCGALFGIGAVTREARWSMISKILGAWVFTLPLAALLASLVAAVAARS